jgi:hypothetical protein
MDDTKPLSAADEAARLVAAGLPPFNRPGLFYRNDIIKSIDKKFNTEPAEASFRAFALHGEPGVGKSTLAYQYASMKLSDKKIDKVLWVYSDQLTSIRQSFTKIVNTKIVTELNEQPLLRDHDENFARILRWIEIVGTRMPNLFCPAGESAVPVPY